MCKISKVKLYLIWQLIDDTLQDDYLQEMSSQFFLKKKKKKKWQESFNPFKKC